MTRDEVLLRLCVCFGVNPPIADFNIVGVNAVLDAVIAAEREECAKVCDAEATIEGIAQRCAAAIRARGEK